MSPVTSNAKNKQAITTAKNRKTIRDLGSAKVSPPV